MPGEVFSLNGHRIAIYWCLHPWCRSKKMLKASRDGVSCINLPGAFRVKKEGSDSTADLHELHVEQSDLGLLTDTPPDPDLSGNEGIPARQHAKHGCDPAGGTWALRHRQRPGARGPLIRFTIL